ncbi:hypothetical protein [Roseivirga sp.]|uniref:hypothetical protein n=1 Tax=Roseivirga sp. TaxID=1964215 RepID=UPI003B8DB1F3
MKSKLMFYTDRPFGLENNLRNYSSIKRAILNQGFYLQLCVILILISALLFSSTQAEISKSQLVFTLLALATCYTSQFYNNTPLYDNEIITGNLDSAADSFSKPLNLSKSRCDFDIKDDIMVNIGSNGAYVETSASDFTKQNSIQSSFIGNLALDLAPLVGISKVGSGFDFASQFAVASNKKSVVLTSYLSGPMNDLFSMNHTIIQAYQNRSFSTRLNTCNTTNFVARKSVIKKQKEINFSKPASVNSAYTLSFYSTKSRRDFVSNDVTVSFGSGGTVTDTVAKPNIILTPTESLKVEDNVQNKKIVINTHNKREDTSDWESVNSTVTISFNFTKSRRDFGSNDNTVSFGSGGTNTVPGPSLNSSSTTFKDYLKLYSYAGSA